MADRYWRGGAGTWDASNTTNWSATSGGAGGASVPTSADNVFFNSASNATAYAVTIGTNAAAGDVTIVGPTAGNVTITSAATSVLNVYGSWTSAATGVAFSSTSGAALNFLATTTGKTITTNNISLGSMSVTFNGVGGGWTLGSNFTVITNATTITAGAFSTGNFTFNGAAISSSGTGVRSVTLGSSTLNLTGSSVWTFTTTTNLTFNAGTSTIICSGASSSTFAGGSLAYANVNFTATSPTTQTISGVNTFTNLSFTSRTTDDLTNIVFSGDQTVSGTLTLGTTNTAVRRMYVQSSTLGTQRTLTVGTLATLSDVDFSDIVAAGASGTWSGTRIGNCKNNSNITFTTAKTVYLASTSGANTNWSGVSWATSTGGTPAVTNFPLAQDTAIIDDSGATSGNGLRTGFTVTMDAAWNLGTVTSTRTIAYTLNLGNSDPNIFGNITLTSALTFGGLSSPTWTFSGQNTTQTITTNGKTITLSNITVNSPGGTVRLLDALTLTFSPTGTTSQFILTAGTLDLNGFTLTPVIFNSSGSGVRTIAFGSTGKIVTTGGVGVAQTVFTAATATNLTVTGSANVECFLTSGYNNTGTTRTISPGSLAEANSLNIYITGSGIDTVLITNTHSFKDLNTSGHGSGGILSMGTSFTSYGNLVLGTGTTFTTSTPTTVMTFGATSGTKTINTNGVAINKSLTFSGVGSTYQLLNNLTSNWGANTLVTHNSGTIDLNNYTFTTGKWGSSNSTTRSIAFGSSGKIVLTDTSGTMYNIDNSANFTYTGTSRFEFPNGGSGTTRSIFHGNAGGTENNSPNIYVTGGSDTVSITGAGRTYRIVDFTGFSGTPQMNGSVYIYGDLVLSATGSDVSADNYALYFAATSGTKTITSNSKIINKPVTFDGVGGTWVLADALNMSAYTFTLTNGTLTTNSNQIYSGTFSSNNSNIRTLNLSSTPWNISGVGTIWDCENSTNLTLNWTPADANALGAHIYSNDTTTPAIWKGGSRAYPFLLITGTDLTFTGSNTFDYVGGFMFSNTTIRFPAGGTTTILYPLLNNGGFKGFGPTQILTLCSSTPGSNTTISKPSANDTIPFDYLSLQDISAISSASSPYAANTTIYYAGPNSISTGNVAGWAFTRGEFLQMF